MKMVLIKVVLVAAMLMTAAEALWLELPTSATKCVSEELHPNVVALVHYAVIGDEEHAEANVLPTISLSVLSPYGKSLHHQENVTYGQFGFTTKEAGNYMACFRLNTHAPGSKGVTIGIDWRTGFAAKDWDSIAKKEKIEGVERELMKLEGLVQAVHENLVYLKAREIAMREVSERTNTKVALFSIMSLSICVMAAAVQVWYLKHFFRKKKLI